MDLRFKQYERKPGLGPSAVLTAVSQVSLIKVYFPISKQEYLRMADGGGSGSVDWLTHASRIPLCLTLADGQLARNQAKSQLRTGPDQRREVH